MVVCNFVIDQDVACVYFCIIVPVLLVCMQGFTENQCLHWVNPLLKYYIITIYICILVDIASYAVTVAWPRDSVVGRSEDLSKKVCTTSG